MSEIINNGRKRIDDLKGLLLDIHKGISVEETKTKLSGFMAAVPYDEVVQAEQELIQEGLPSDEVLKFCDLHSEALKGTLDTSSAKTYENGHPVDTFIKENKEVHKQIDKLKHIRVKNSLLAGNTSVAADASEALHEIHFIFNALMDLEKHYQRKENLIFSFMERYKITGPPMVMWGKDDEVRSFLKSSIQLLRDITTATAEDLDSYFELIFNPAIKAVEEMIFKEEKILFPMCMDIFTENDWYEISSQSDEIGYCLYAPDTQWKPAGSENKISSHKGTAKNNGTGKIQLSTGSFTLQELEAFFGALPVDITFVDKDDNVRFFSHGEDRIFQRNKAILGRKVQFCHPPSSVHVVEQILNDFKSGKQDSAKFWINIKDKLVHIAYYAMRDENKEYLGVVEVTQDIKPFKSIEGERRILQYEE